MEKIALRVKNWIRQNRKEAVLLMIIILVSGFLRLYRIDEYLTFLGDEGRDVIIVRRLLMYGDIILVGPGTSIGNMYLGPLYYYLMAPFLFLANYSPVGPAVMVALMGVATVFLVWYIAREWFPSTRDARSGQVAWGALIAAFLYAISPTVIIFSKASWNPNIMPFFALIAVYSIYRVWQKSEFKWLIVAGISFAFCLQSHYLALLLVPPIGLFWIITFLKARLQKEKLNKLFKYTFIGGLLFALLMSPLVIFDARHGWRNVEAIRKFFAERQTTVSARPWNALPNMYPQLEKITTRLLGGRDIELGKWLTIGMVIPLMILILSKRKNLPPAFWLLLSWLGVGVLGLGLYKQEIYDHYYGFLFPVPFLLFGFLVERLIAVSKSRRLLLIATSILVFYIGLVSLQNSPLRYPPNRQLQRSESVAREIIKQSRNEKFNLAVIAERNYEGAYQYFLESWGSKFTSIDPVNTKDTIANQLFVVCELPKEKCDPTHNPKAEVANFGWSKIENEWNIEGVIIFKLVHSR